MVIRVSSSTESEESEPLELTPITSPSLMEIVNIEGEIRNRGEQTIIALLN